MTGKYVIHYTFERTRAINSNFKVIVHLKRYGIITSNRIYLSNIRNSLILGQHIISSVRTKCVPPSKHFSFQNMIDARKNGIFNQDLALFMNKSGPEFERGGTP